MRNKTMEITSGIHRVNGIIGANCYLIITESKMLVIDTGIPGNGSKIINYIKRIGKNPFNIDYVILTHADIDHIGSAAEIKKITGAKIAIHANDAPVLSGKSGPVTSRGRGPLRIFFKLITRLMRFYAVEPDIILGDDFEVDHFKVIYTPGHTKGSICLYLPGKAIFVGDALSSDSKGNPRPLRKRNILSADMAGSRESLIKISQLEFDILLPGHGAPVIGKASSKLRNRLISHPF